MPAGAGRDLGASVLPFGLTTDVSAGALAAGAGSALAGGQASAGAAASSVGGKANGFAEELSSISGQGAAKGAGQDKGQVSAVVSTKTGRAVDPVKSGPVAAQIQTSVVTGELAPAVAVDPTVPVTDPLFSGDIVAGTPPLNAGQPGDADQGLLPSEGDEAAQTADVALAAEFAPVAPVAPVVPAPAGEGAAITPAFVDGGAPGAALSGSAGLAGNVPAVPAAGAASGAAPVPAADAGVGAGSGGSAPATAPNFAGALNGVEASAAQPERAGQATPAKVADAQAAVARPAPVTTERRWQSELPKEFRASVTPTAQPAGQQPAVTLPVQASVQAGAVVGGQAPGQGAGEAPGLQVAAATPAGTVAASVSAVAKAAAASEGTQVPAVPAAPVVDGETSAQPVAANTQTSEASAQAGTAMSAATTQVAAAVNAGAVPVQQPVQATPQPVSSEQLLAGEPVAEEGAGLVKPVTGEASGPQGAGNAQDAAAGPAAKGAEQTGPEPRGAALAGPVAAAALSNIAADEADMPAELQHTSISGEFGAATVRGGDLAGAMRTESLQAPSQSQSGQVATQVAAEIARNLKDGQTRFQMRFDPPELGRVEVEMKVSHDGKVQAHLRVDRPETLDMFLRDQRGLERALEAAGLNPDSDNLQFSLRQDGGQQFGSEQGGDGHQPASNGGGGTVSAEADPMLEDIVRMTIAEQRGGLDMKV
ncbi:flagellar hook-length control protein FliK [Roseibium sp.]|uniref:flagellar hook-length control protein FliK n=1 Tax=Roseibium sp. TaxID=1936156 RepID=UPI00351216A6